MMNAVLRKPDHQWLFEIASEQQGYFTAEQARTAGFSWALLSHFVKSGRFLRLRRGFYRLRDFPASPREEVMAAWVAAGKDVAVVSRESALDLLGLSDVIPNAVHLTVPRARANIPALPGTVVHTTTRPLGEVDIVVRDGMRVTAPARTILDAAEAGVGPEQIESAVAEALNRGLVTARQLSERAGERGERVARLIAGALARARGAPQ